MKNNQEPRPEQQVSSCRCRDCSCHNEEKHSGAQEPNASGCDSQGEMSGFVKEEESAARQVEEGEAREGQVDQGQEPEGADVGPLDPETLKEEAVRWQERAEELTQQLLRLQADFDNYRKRSRRDLQEGIIRANEELVRQLLPVLDNLERALAADSDASEDSIREGVQLIYRQFMDILSREGLEPIRAVGEDFDPNLHDAVMMEAVEDPEMENQILQEFQKGYTFRERVLRAAVVKVARASD